MQQKSDPVHELPPVSPPMVVVRRFLRRLGGMFGSRQQYAKTEFIVVVPNVGAPSPEVTVGLLRVAMTLGA